MMAQRQAGADALPDRQPEELVLRLLCFSLGSARFGIDIEEVAAISLYRPADEEEEDLWRLHQVLAYPAPPVYRAPRIITMKEGGGEEKPFRLVIDAPDDVREYDWREVRPLPVLIAPVLRPRGLWGVLAEGETMRLLLNCRPPGGGEQRRPG